MKKELKEKILSEFKIFLDKNNLEVAKNFYGKGVIIKKKESDNGYYSTYIETLLFEAPFINIQGESNGNSHFLKFIKTLLVKKETQALALQICIEKEPSMKEYGYEVYFKHISNILLGYKDVYLQFITRDKFLNNNLEKIVTLVDSVDSQISKEVIIDKSLNVASFKILKNQSTIYNLIQKSIFNKKKYEYSFPEITKNINDNFIVGVKKDERLIFQFDILKLNSLFIKEAYGKEGIKNHFRGIDYVIKQEYLNELNISMMSIVDGGNTNIIEVHIYGLNLNETKLNDFLKILINQKLSNNINNVEDLSKVIKEAIIETNYNSLNTLLTSEKNHNKRLKL